MLKLSTTLPVRTRVPLAGWTLAGALTVLSLASSLLQTAASADHTPSRVGQAHHTGAICQDIEASASRG